MAMSDFNLRCDAEPGVMVTLSNDVKGVSLCDLDLLKDHTSTQLMKRQNEQADVQTHTKTDSVSLAAYLLGLRKAVQDFLISQNHKDLARYAFPLLNCEILDLIKDVETQHVHSRQCLQDKIEVSDNMRSHELANARNMAFATLSAWRTELELNVKEYCKEISDAISKTADIDKKYIASKSALCAEASNLRNVTKGLRLGSLKSVWEERLNAIIEQEQKNILLKLGDFERRQKQQIANNLIESKVHVSAECTMGSELLVVQCCQYACRLAVLNAMHDIQSMLVANAKDFNLALESAVVKLELPQ